MFVRLGAAADRVVRRYMPDPFVLVLALALVTFAAATTTLALHGVPTDHPGVLTHTSALGAAWRTRALFFKGFSELLTFAMQMVLIVVSGEAIAASPPVSRAMRRIASVPRSAGSAVFMVAAIALALGWFHWGFGLMGSATLAREVAASCRQRGVRVHYPLLGAAAYMAMLLWHAGLSATAPLLINSPTHFLVRLIGVVPLSQTIFRPMNLAVCALLFVTIPFLLRAMTPPPADTREIDDALLGSLHESDAAGSGASQPLTPADRLDRFRGWTLAVSILGVWFLVQYFRERSIYGLNLDVLNYAFVVVGMALYASPVEYARAIARSVRGTSGIVLQFPFYGAIMAMMRDSGLNALLGQQFHAIANAHTFPFFTFVASLLTKLFVPSGAGEWAVEGPVMLGAARSLHASIGLTTMGVAYGNMAGNMYQPFWALPMLGILGLRARDIMGYALVVFAVAAPVLGVALWIAG